MSGKDLLVIALSGVQRFISESRTTVDLRSGSLIVAELARRAAQTIAEEPGAEVVFPNPAGTTAGGDGMPNRVVALLPPGRGPEVAVEVAESLHNSWSQWACEVFGARDVEEVPGWPSVQWASAPHTLGDYADQWRVAQQELAARKGVRDFVQAWTENRAVCSLSPRWPAAASKPRGLPRHEQDEVLATANWVKRRWHKTETGRSSGFPSTSAIASAPFRAAVMEHWSDPEVASVAEELRGVAEELAPDPWESAVAGLPPAPGSRAGRWMRAGAGRWVFPESWNAPVLARDHGHSADDRRFVNKVAKGRRAASALAELMADRGVAPPAPHLAVLVQDLDSMGSFLAGRTEGQDDTSIDLSLSDHQEVSELLVRSASQQRAVVESRRVLGMAVYAGGDDLLCLLPASTALEAAHELRFQVPARLPSASTGVVFFHHSSSLRHALGRAREALETAKGAYAHKNGLAVGYLRRSGSHALCVQDWQAPHSLGEEHSPAQDLSVFAPATRTGAPVLSPSLVGDLERSQRPLDESDLPDRFFRAEMDRLVGRHVHAASREAADDFAHRASEALVRLGGRAPAARSGFRVPLDAARVAVFLRQEA